MVPNRDEALFSVDLDAAAAPSYSVNAYRCLSNDSIRGSLCRNQWSQLLKACGMRGAEAWFVILFTFRVWTSLFRIGGLFITKRRIAAT